MTHDQDDDKQVIHTPAAPAVVGPYSQAIRAGGFIYTAGQIALDPASGKLVGETIEEQTRRVLDNLQAVLEAAGSAMSKVVKTTVFITDMAHFARMNAVYAEYFPSKPPARSTLPMASLPLGGLVEIECVALA